jgi:hypothetical protein
MQELADGEVDDNRFSAGETIPLASRFAVSESLITT